jgi:predicted dehydrogenase
MQEANSHVSRRQFVNNMIAAGAGTFLAGAIPGNLLAASSKRLPNPKRGPQENISGQKLGWAVAGLGDFGEKHVLPALAASSYCTTTALISGSPEKAARLADKYRVKKEAIYNYQNMSKLRDNSDVDVVYIVTPNSTHAELTVKAFEAGKHVMCEKPMANSPAECRRMIDAAKAAKKKLMIAYRVHFEPNNLIAKEMIDSGKLGRISFATSDTHRPLEKGNARDAWRMKKSMAGGGSLVDVGVYSLNGMIWYMGENPSEVFGSSYSTPNDDRFAEVENTFLGQLKFPSGRIANISSGYDATRKRADIFGSEMALGLDPSSEYEGNKLYSLKNKETQLISSEDSYPQFTGEVDHLAKAILENSEVKTPGEMGLRDVQIIHALYESAKTGRWVKTNLS